MPSLNPSEQRRFAAEVVEKLTARGFTAYWAGGCVRDLLMQRMPKDYDVATSARPDEIRQTFGHRRTLAIGAAFGVITVLGPEGAGQVEVATFRQDASYSDGRHPDAVSFSTPEEDARRRDFTINGMFLDPTSGHVVDYVGGREDLQRKVIRAIGDPAERFTEDKLRMLRAVRFAATLGFDLSADTRSAIQHMAPQIAVVSAERIAAEMRLILTASDKAAAARELRSTGLLEVLLPEVFHLPPIAWDRTSAVLAALGDVDFATALAALVHLMPDKQLVARVADRWKLTNKEEQKTAWLVTQSGALEGASRMAWSKLQPLLVNEYGGELARLHAARATAGLAEQADVEFCRAQLERPRGELDPSPILTGDDLINHGVPRGKLYSVLLQAVRDAQLDGQISDRTQALALVDELVARGTLP